MRASQGLWAAFAGVMSLCVQARAPDVSGLKTYSLPEYTLITHDAYTVRHIVPEIASMESFLSKLLNHKVRPTGTPTYILAVRSSLWEGYLQPGAAIGSEYVPTRFANYLLIDDDSGALRGAISHEYAHFFLHTQLRGRYPLWFDEGLAELVENSRPHAGSAIIRSKGYFQPGWLPMERFLRIDKTSPEYLSEPTSSLFHQESWAMVHKGFFGDRKFGAKIFAYLRARDEMRPIDVAVKEGFEMTFTELDKTIGAYIGNGRDVYSQYEFDRPSSIETGPGQSLSEFDSLVLLANAMLATGFKAQQLGEVVGAAEKLAPSSIDVRVLKIRMAVRDRDDSALESLSKQINPGTVEQPLARGAGLALFERVREENSGGGLSATQRAAWNIQAFALLDRSLAEQPDDAEACWGFGILAARLKRTPDLASLRLERASALVPMNPDLAMAKALLAESTGRKSEMISYLAETALNATTEEQRVWALGRIESARAAAQGAPNPQ